MPTHPTRRSTHTRPSGRVFATVAIALSFAGLPFALANPDGREPSPKPAEAPVDLFASNDAALVALRRELRLALVPRPAAPPPLPEAWEPYAANEIDRFIFASWRHASQTDGGQTSPEAHASRLWNPDALPTIDDHAFARRVYLDLIGVVPTLDELDRFVSSREPDKRAALVAELLARTGDYADHWTPFWEDAIASSYAALQGGIPTRGNYRQWINDAFKDNRPYDLFAAQIIDFGTPGANPPVMTQANGKPARVVFVRNETHTETLQTAAVAAQVFMGTAMKCASCHNHFENDEWPQTRFLAFAGLFSQHDLEVIRCEKRMGRTVAAAFPFDPEGGEEAMAALPSEIPADEAGRLRLAAALITDPANPRFARSIVNRLWKRYMGLGLVEPADDFRLEIAPSHPELLDWLAYDLMAHDFDLKRTITLILNSRVYQLRFDATLADAFDVSDKHAPRFYRSPALRRLTAEQIVDSIRLAMRQSLDPAQRLYHVNQSTALSRSLGKPASRNEISTQRPDDVAVVQSLELLNGPELIALIGGGPLLDRVQDQSHAEAARTLYLAFLSRPPMPAEASAAAAYLGAAPDAQARRDALVDLCWALVVSPEFQYLR